MARSSAHTNLNQNFAKGSYIFVTKMVMITTFLRPKNAEKYAEWFASLKMIAHVGTIEHPRFAGKNKKKAIIQIQNNASVDDQNALQTFT